MITKIINADCVLPGCEFIPKSPAFSDKGSLWYKFAFAVEQFLGTRTLCVLICEYSITLALYLILT